MLAHAMSANFRVSALFSSNFAPFSSPANISIVSTRHPPYRGCSVAFVLEGHAAVGAAVVKGAGGSVIGSGEQKRLIQQGERQAVAGQQAGWSANRLAPASGRPGCERRPRALAAARATAPAAHRRPPRPALFLKAKS